MTVKIGIIGGSGLENPQFLKDAREEVITTPWGEPSGPVVCGTINGVPVAMLSRHGKEHTLSPSKVNYRANVAALKILNCSCIVATTAVGSLREEVAPGDLLVMDQFIDFTRQRKMTFYEEFEPHKPVHASLADPFDARLRQILVDACKAKNVPHHEKGTLVTIEGPRFSTRAESHMFRSWGADIINMSVATEAILANEAAIPYAAIAMITDYDCWREGEEAVTWEMIVATFGENVNKVTNVLMEAIPNIGKCNFAG